MKPDTIRNTNSRVRDLSRYYHHDPLLGWAKTALQNAKVRARKRGIKFNLSLEDVYNAAKTTTHCCITGVPLYFGRGHGKPGQRSASVDRIDNDADYTKESIAVISRRANALKNNCSLDEMIALGQYAMLQKHNAA